MVRTRIAPSPTGQDLHIGNLYTALINWVWARKNKGQFIVRIEDTDRKRYVEGAEKRILQTLKNYGLDYDESVDKGGEYGPYRQSERLDVYKKYIDKLISQGKAYYCFCSPERLTKLREEQRKQGKMPRYDKYCLHHFSKEEARRKVERGESYVVRLNVPENKEISFNDMIRGRITINTNAIDDQVLVKSDGYPTYQLAVVIDDHLMKISHVIRAEEWISSTPKQVLLYEALGWKLPTYAHVPILRNPDKSKLSKRKNPVWASWYLSEGYLPEAVLNYLALMGWAHPEEKEIFSLTEFIDVFNLKDIKPVGPVFDIVKLTWMNGEYIRRMKDEVLSKKLFDFFKGKYSLNLIRQSVPLVKTRIKTLKEYDKFCSFFLKAPQSYEKDLSHSLDILRKVKAKLELVGTWKADKITNEVVSIAREEKIGVGKVFMTLRVSITGKKITPPISESMEILGKDESLRRIDDALKFYQA